MNALQQIIALVIILVICFIVAGIGSVATTPNIESWYKNLAKPAWTPPNWLFGPVWTILYITMAISAWLVWRDIGLSKAAIPLAIFALQLILNALWSWLFFGAHNPGAAMVEIVALWAAILATIILFWRITPLAGALMLPYIAWVTFASALNFAIWRLYGA